MGVGISSAAVQGVYVDLEMAEDHLHTHHACELSSPSMLSSPSQLDVLGGVKRGPVRRGETLMRKMEMLEAKLNVVAASIETALSDNSNDLSLVEKLNHQGVTVPLHKLKQALVFGLRTPVSDASRGHLTRPGTAVRQQTKQDVAKEMPHIKLDIKESDEHSMPLMDPVPRRGISENGESMNWREHIARAKATAKAYVGPVARIQALGHLQPRRTLQSDSLSFYVRDILGDDYKRAVDAISLYDKGKNIAQEAKDEMKASIDSESAHLEANKRPVTSPSSPRKSPGKSCSSSQVFPSSARKAAPSSSREVTLSSSRAKAAPLPPSGTSCAPNAISARGIKSALSIRANRSANALNPYSRPYSSKPENSLRPLPLSNLKGSKSCPATALPVFGHSEASKEEMLEKLAQGNAGMEAASPLLSVFANRGNSLAATNITSNKWNGPMIHNSANFARAAKAGLAELYKKDVITKLRNGCYAMQIMLGDNYLHIHNSMNAPSLWSVDPWMPLKDVFPARVASLERVQGVGMGMRMLASLVINAEALAGPEAIKKLHLIINCISEQESRIIADLQAWGFCGLARENILIMVEKQRPGFKFDPSSERFIPVSGSQQRLTGNGFTMQHLAWPSEAYILCDKGNLFDKDDASDGKLGPAEGGRRVLKCSAIDYLASRGCIWLMSQQLRDVCYLSQGIFDVDDLAYCLFLHEQSSTNLFVYADAGVKGMRDEALLVANDSSSGLVFEIKASSLCTPEMIQQVNDLKQASGGKLCVGTGRYLANIQNLAKQLIPSTFRPAITFIDGLAYLRFDISDVSLTEGTKCMALASKSRSISFISAAESADSILPMIHSQDSGGRFRGLLSLISAGMPGSPCPTVLAAVKPGSHLDAKPFNAGSEAVTIKPSSQGKLIALLLADNSSSMDALNLALSILRPGHDVLHLITAKPVSQSEAMAKALIDKYTDLARVSLANVQSTVLTGGSIMHSILEFIDRIKPDLVVLGSQANLQVAASLPIGSVSISLMRSIMCPVLLVNHKAGNAKISVPNDPLRCMVSIDHTSRPLLRFLCEKILNPPRLDKVFLARGQATNKATNEELLTSRRLLDDFGSMAARLRVEAIKRPLEGRFIDEGPKMADFDKCHILAIQLPDGKAGQLPQSVGLLLKRSKSALLIYRNPPRDST